MIALTPRKVKVEKVTGRKIIFDLLSIVLDIQD